MGGDLRIHESFIRPVVLQPLRQPFIHTGVSNRHGSRIQEFIAGVEDGFHTLTE
jgi:hypothetical protein